MISALLLGSLTTVINLAIQVMMILLIVRRLTTRFDRSAGRETTGRGMRVLVVVLALV